MCCVCYAVRQVSWSGRRGERRVCVVRAVDEEGVVRVVSKPCQEQSRACKDVAKCLCGVQNAMEKWSSALPCEPRRRAHRCSEPRLGEGWAGLGARSDLIHARVPTSVPGGSRGQQGRAARRVATVESSRLDLAT